jgi:hypothetical protein
MSPVVPDHQAPHRSVRVFVRAITATALFRIWPTLIFMGGWSLMVVMVNRNTDVEFTFPATMVTVLVSDHAARLFRGR